MWGSGEFSGRHSKWGGWPDDFPDLYPLDTDPVFMGSFFCVLFDMQRSNRLPPWCIQDRGFHSGYTSKWWLASPIPVIKAKSFRDVLVGLCEPVQTADDSVVFRNWEVRVRRQVRDLMEMDDDYLILLATMYALE